MDENTYKFVKKNREQTCIHSLMAFLEVLITYTRSISESECTELTNKEWAIKKYVSWH